MKETDRLNILKMLVAVALAVIIVLMVIPGGFAKKSRANEEDTRGGIHTEAYFANDEDQDGGATATDACLADVSYYNSIISGDLVKYNGENYTRFYVVYMKGDQYRAYCGDHQKNAVRSTDKVAFARTNDIFLRRVFYYSPHSEHAWNGFKDMSENDRQLIMTLTLNYLRNGQYFNVIGDYYNYISSDSRKTIKMDGDETGLSMKEVSTGVVLGSSAELEGKYIYKESSTGKNRKRTRIIKLEGNENNYINVKIPKDTWLHVSDDRGVTYQVCKSGSTRIDCGDFYYFSAQTDHEGQISVGEFQGQPGITVYTADSTDCDVDQTLLFSGAEKSDSVSMNIEWQEEQKTGYMWMAKNKAYDVIQNQFEHTTDYNYDRYGLNNYSYAGISYVVSDKRGQNVFRFVLSYDGKCYVNKNNGRRLVFRDLEEHKAYSGKYAFQYAQLPIGEYTVEETPMLWICDNKTGDITETKIPVTKSGYELNKRKGKVTITEENDTASRSKAVFFLAEDTPVKGQLRLKKTDSENGVPVGGAEYCIVRRASGIWENDVQIARMVTNDKGEGVVTEGIFGGRGTTTLSDLPVGRYEVYEDVPPKDYLRNTDVAEVDVTGEGIAVTVNGKKIIDTSDMCITWNTSDKYEAGCASMNIYKRDSGTGEKAQGTGTLAGAEFEVKYYNKQYKEEKDLPDKADKTWILNTDDSGYCCLDNKYLSRSEKSDDLLFDRDGKIIIPVGTVTIQETKPPQGYTLTADDKKIYMDRIVKDDDAVHLEKGNTYIAQNSIIRGDFSFIKKAAGTGKAIGGVKFLLESEDGSQSVSIYTDDNGCYSSSSDNILHSHNTNRGESGDGIWFGESEVDDKLGALPYGTYRLSELECEANAGKYKLIEPVIFEIKEDSGTVDLGIIYNEDDTTTEATTEVTTETTTEVTTEVTTEATTELTTEVTTEVTTENTTETTTGNTTEATTGNTTENTTEVTSGDTTEATTKVTTEISDTPDTGDGIPVMLILILMAGAVVSIAGVIFYKKKYSEMDKRR